VCNKCTRNIVRFRLSFALEQETNFRRPRFQLAQRSSAHRVVAVVRAAGRGGALVGPASRRLSQRILARACFRATGSMSSLSTVMFSPENSWTRRCLTSALHSALGSSANGTDLWLGQAARSRTRCRSPFRPRALSGRGLGRRPDVGRLGKLRRVRNSNAIRISERALRVYA